MSDRLSLYRSGKCKEAAPPSLATEKESIDASSPLLEVPITIYYMRRGMQTRAVSQWQINTCLPIFCHLGAERATRQRRPLLHLKTNRLMLPALAGSAHCNSLHAGRCERGRFHNSKQIPVCRSFTLYSRRGRRSNVYLFYS